MVWVVNLFKGLTKASKMNLKDLSERPERLGDYDADDDGDDDYGDDGDDDDDDHADDDGDVDDDVADDDADAGVVEDESDDDGYCYFVDAG